MLYHMLLASSSAAREHGMEEPQPRRRGGSHETLTAKGATPRHVWLRMAEGRTTKVLATVADQLPAPTSVTARARM